MKKGMTEKEALKVLVREEKRFKDAGFGRGVERSRAASNGIICGDEHRRADGRGEGRAAEAV